MPQRMMSVFAIVLGLAGLLALGVLILLRMDVRKAATKGPRWRRTLIGAALVLVSGFEVTIAGRRLAQEPDEEPAPVAEKEKHREPPIEYELFDQEFTATSGPAPAPAPQTGPTLEASAHWRHLCRTWLEARETVSGHRGLYPYNIAGQNRLIRELVEACRDVRFLVRNGAISPSEAKLLMVELNDLHRRTRDFYTIEQGGVTCYSRSFEPAARSERAVNLEARLTLLDTLLAEGKLRPTVIVRALGYIEAEIHDMAPGNLLLGWESATLPTEYMLECAAVRRMAIGKVERIHERLTGGVPVPLQDRPQWKTIAEAWEYIMRRGGAEKVTAQDAIECTRKVWAVREAADWLATAGALRLQEAQLLQWEFERLAGDRVQVAVGKEIAAAMRDETLPTDPMDRFTARLCAMLDLWREKRTTPCVLEKILPSLEAELKQMSVRPPDRELTDERKMLAKGLMNEGKMALRELKKALQEAK